MSRRLEGDKEETRGRRWNIVKNILIAASFGGPYEKVLLDALMKNYNTQNRCLPKIASPS